MTFSTSIKRMILVLLVLTLFFLAVPVIPSVMATDYTYWQSHYLDPANGNIIAGSNPAGSILALYNDDDPTTLLSANQVCALLGMSVGDAQHRVLANYQGGGGGIFIGNDADGPSFNDPADYNVFFKNETFFNNKGLVYKYSSGGLTDGYGFIATAYCNGAYRLDPNTFYVYHRGAAPLYTVDFTANVYDGIVPFNVQFTSSSTNFTTTSGLWDFGDGGSSTSLNPLHEYTVAGLYTVKFDGYNGTRHASKTFPAMITAYKGDNFTYHLDLDVRDNKTGAYIQNSNIGIYDYLHSVWRNTTCALGACGFMDTGANHEYPLNFSATYRIAASSQDYNATYKDVQFLYDHQLVTLNLDYANNATSSDIRHLALDVKSGTSGGYVYNTTISLYDPYFSVWNNKTCQYGACGWTRSGPSNEYNLLYGSTYDLYASKDGYISANQTVVFSYDTQLFTLYLTPTNTSVDVNHLDVDVKFANNESFVEGSDLSLYDPDTLTFYNQTCINGACGFIRSTPTTPIAFYHTYRISASKPGFVTAYQNVVLSFDHQIFTLRMIPLQDISPTSTINFTFTPNYNVPVFPTVTGTLATNGTMTINTTVNFLNITMPATLPALPYYMNKTYVRADLVSKFAPIDSVLTFVDAGMTLLFFVQAFLLTLIIAPLAYVLSANTSVTSILFAYLSSWSVLAAPIVWVIGVTQTMLGPKIEACIIVAMCYDIILQIRDTVSRA